MPFNIKSNFVIKTSAKVNPRPATVPTDQYWNNVSLLINGDSSISDYKGNSLSITNVTRTTSQKKYGAGALDFTSDGSYITVPNSSSFDLSSGDFTIEFWAYPVSSATWKEVINKTVAGGNGYSPYRIIQHNSGVWAFLANNNGTSDWNVAGADTWNVAGANGRFQAYTINTWQHIAVTRQGNTFRCFKDGVLGTTITNSSTLWSNTDTLKIGRETVNSPWNGYLDDIRITKGVARYTGSFTPPSSSLPTS